MGALSIFVFGSITVRTLVPLFLAKLGEADAVIGLVSSAYPAGFLAGCLIVAPLTRWLRIFPALSLVGVFTTVATFSFLYADGVVGWTGLRVCAGIGQGCMLTIMESWLQSVTPSTSRGRVTATYQTLAKVVAIGGQSLIAAELPDELLFLMCSSGFLLALAPVAFTERPAPPTRARPDFMGVVRLPSVAASGCAAAGLLNLALMSLAPVYVLQAGYSVADAGLLAITMQVGGIVVQWPLGWASDRYDRRMIVAAIVTTGGLGALLVMLASGSYLAVMAGFTIACGVSQGIFGQASADAYDKIDRADIMSVSSGLNILWSLGSITGPLAATALMQVVGRDGLALYVLVVSAAVAAHAIWMIVHSPARR